MPRLGSEKNPLQFSVHSKAHALALISLCEKRGWKALVRVAPDAPEDTADLDRVRDAPILPARVAEKIGRNDSCPCGSGKKFKKCCA